MSGRRRFGPLKTMVDEGHKEDQEEGREEDKEPILRPVQAQALC